MESKIQNKMDSASLKLQSVVLFKSGIGSFQKYGVIDLSEENRIKISFKDSVINDLLKTFSILKLSGDLKVSGVSYEAKETNQQKLLEDSSISLPEKNTFSALLGQLRGISVKIYSYDQEYIGKVIGMQVIPEAERGEAVINKNHLVLSDNSNLSKIITIKVSKITGLEILNPKIKKDLNFFMEIITDQNKHDKKTINLFFNGSEKSEFILNFLQEVPAWKTTYRLFMDEKSTTDEKSAGEHTLQLQAWAIIDNVLDEDWDNVDLTLVSGLPISFTYDSYSPAWKQRPNVERDTDLGVKVVQFEQLKQRDAGGYKAKKGARPRSTGRGLGMAPPGPPGGPPSVRSPSPASPSSMRGLRSEIADTLFSMTSASEAPVAAFGDEMGIGYGGDDDDFEGGESAFESSSEATSSKGLSMKYHINNPVFVKRNNSSLIPLLQSDLKGKIISIYNKSINKTKPIKHIQLHNENYTLEKGPIAIYINNIFAGEAIMNFLEPTATTKIPFAVDQSVDIIHKITNRTENYHKIDIEQYIVSKYFKIQTHSYKIENLTEEPKTIEIEHPKTSSFKIYDATLEFDEESKSYYTYSMVVKPKETIKFKINERSLQFSRTDSSTITYNIIEAWLERKLIDSDEYDFLNKKIRLETEKTMIESDLVDTDNKIYDIDTQQARVRENLIALGSSDAEKELRSKYIKKMNLQEDDYEKLSEEKLNLQSKLKDIQEKISDAQSEWIKAMRKKEQLKKEGENNE